jgi:hypothetical protein
VLPALLTLGNDIEVPSPMSVCIGSAHSEPTNRDGRGVL